MSELSRTTSFKRTSGEDLVLFIYSNDTYLFFITNMFQPNMDYTIIQITCTNAQGNILSVYNLYKSLSEFGVWRIYSSEGYKDLSDPHFAIDKGADYIQSTCELPEIQSIINEVLGFQTKGYGIYHPRLEYRFSGKFNINGNPVLVSSLSDIPGLMKIHGVNPVFDALENPVTEHLQQLQPDVLGPQMDYNAMFRDFINSTRRQLSVYPFNLHFDPDRQTIYNEEYESDILYEINRMFHKSSPQFVGKHIAVLDNVKIPVLTYKICLSLKDILPDDMSGIPPIIIIYFIVAKFQEGYYCNIILITPGSITPDNSCETSINEIGLPGYYIPSILAYKIIDYQIQAKKIVSGQEVDITGDVIADRYVNIGKDRNLELFIFFGKLGLTEIDLYNVISNTEEYNESIQSDLLEKRKAITYQIAALTALTKMPGLNEELRVNALTRLSQLTQQLPEQLTSMISSASSRLEALGEQAQTKMKTFHQGPKNIDVNALKQSKKLTKYITSQKSNRGSKLTQKRGIGGKRLKRKTKKRKTRRINKRCRSNKKKKPHLL